MFCNNCGTYNRDGANFCSKCGAKFSSNQSENNLNAEHFELVDSILEKWNTNDYDSDDSSAPKNKKRIEVAFTIVAAIVMLSIGFYAAFKDIFVKHNEKSYVSDYSYKNSEDNDDDNYYLDKNDNKIYYDESTATTNTEPIMPYKIGEEIYILGKIDSANTLEYSFEIISDDITWIIDCSNVEFFDKLYSLVDNKEVKFIGNVSGEFEIKFTSVEVDGKTYNVNDSFSSQVIYDNNGIKITYKGLSKSTILSRSTVEFNLLIENNTNKDYTVQVRNFSINGYMVESIFSPSVAAGKKINDAITVHDETLTDNGITDCEDIEFKFHFFNSDDWSDDFDSDIISIKEL